VKRLLRLLPRSLAGRVFALYTATLLVFGAAGLAVFVAYFVNADIEDAAITSEMLIEVLAQTTTDSAVIGDYDTIRKSLDRAVTREWYRDASFIDLRGGTVTAARHHAAAAEAPSFLKDRVAALLPALHRPINAGGVDYGVLRLRYDVEHIAGTYWQFTRLAFVIGALAVGAGLLVIAVPVRRWLGNLDRLQSFEQAIARGDADAAKYLGADAPEEIRRTFELLGRTASSLQSEREHAAVTLAAIGEAVLSLDHEGRVNYANPAATELLAPDGAALAGMPVKDVLAEGFPDGAPREGWRSRRLRLAAGPGGGRVLDTTLSPIAGDGGWVLAARDVTESHRLEERLRTELAARQDALASLRGLLEGLLPAGAHARRVGSGDIGAVSALVAELVREREAGRRALDNQKFALDQHAIVSVTDREGRIVYANDRFCETTGWARERLLGQRHSIISSGLHSRALYDELWTTVKGGRVWQGELCNRTREGRLRWFSSTIVPLAGEAGEPEEFIGISTDITALKEAEAALVRARDAAEAANRAKSDFLANMSHEIRTPMNGIIGMSSLVLDSDLDAEQREFVGIVKSSAEALLAIINDILDFSKVEAGKLVVESLPFDPRRAVEETLRSLELPARAKALALEAQFDPSVPPQVAGDAGRFRQVLLNLVGNAIKFTPAGTIRVRVRALEEGPGWRLETAVADPGIGIAPAKLADIFDAFTQADTSITRSYGGTGLGLTISRRLVELMGGSIRVESEPGRGSTFTFDVAVGRPAGDLSTARAAALAGKRVLVVDDAEERREALARLLSAWGVRIERADGANAALAKLMSGARVDAILVDASMPDLAGEQFAAVLAKGAYASVRAPVLLLEASGRRAPGEAPPAGVARAVATPVSAGLLAEALAELVAPASPPPAPELGLRVLLVEDNVINERVAVALLERRGCRVSVARDGEEGVRAACDGTYDLVLMDMQMPVLDGLDATRALRAREAALGRPRVPVLAMTANARDEDREACLAAGMDDFLAKPIRPDELFARLERLRAAPVAA